jgi:flagellar biosynthesis/type III secretory pathway chaperone
MDHEGTVMSETIDAALAAAEELLLVLEEEAEILKRFKSEELLNLLPRKELLVGKLHRKMVALHEAESEGRDTEWDSLRARLKSCLNEIQKLNDSNRVFIEGTLSYWQEFLDIFRRPSLYGSGLQGAQGQAYALKGLAFSKEV